MFWLTAFYMRKKPCRPPVYTFTDIQTASAGAYLCIVNVDTQPHDANKASHSGREKNKN